MATPIHHTAAAALKALAALALLSACAGPPRVAQQPVRPVWASSYPIPVLAFDTEDSFADDQVQFMDPYTYYGSGRT